MAGDNRWHSNPSFFYLFGYSHKNAIIDSVFPCVAENDVLVIHWGPASFFEVRLLRKRTFQLVPTRESEGSSGQKKKPSMTIPDEAGENRANQKAAAFDREACRIQAASPVLPGVQGGVAGSLSHGVKCLPFRELLKCQRKLATLAILQEPELERHLGNQCDGLDFSRP